jgi:beta-N-acetylhexosaminidase
MTTTLRRAAGSLLVVGLSGTELSGLERAWLKLVAPAGIILFRRNIAGVKQTRALLAEAGKFCARHSLRCVDVEGGTVDRLRDALAPLPSAQAVAQRAREAGKPALARVHGELIARAIKAFGFNVTLAPVLDLGLPSSAAIMGTRCAGATSAEIVAYARGILAGLKAHGITGCGKHFPGLGGGTRDSHLETPEISRSWSYLWRDDLAPYRELSEELPMVMVSHAAYPQTLGRDRPATAASYWIESILRRRIGFRGIAFSDDMEMGGILKFLPIEEAVIAALRAGMDLLEICHSPELILRAYEAMIGEAERSPAFRSLLLKRADATARKRAKLFTKRIDPALSARQFEALRTQVLRFGDGIGPAAASPSIPSKSATRAETA